MSKTIFSFLLIIALMFSLQNCQQSETPNDSSLRNNSANDASVLLVDDDPTGLESNTDFAFMLDNRGMIFFFLLDLTDEQKAAIKAIHMEYRPGFKSFHGDWDRRKASWDDIKAQRDSVHALIYDEIIKLLTEDQKALLDEINTQLANGEYPTILVGHRVAKLDESLNLSEDQQNQIAVLFADYGAKILAARDASKNRIDFITARMTLGAELNEKITALLTAEQLDIYNSLLKKKQRHMRGRGLKNP